MTQPQPSIKALPKVDIHRHLEGSLRLATLLEIVRSENLSLPGEIESLRSRVEVVGDAPVTTDEFLAKFKTIRMFFRSREIIERLVYEVIEDASEDNLRLLELRFTPAALAQAGDFELEEVTDWVLLAAEKAGTKFGVKVACVMSVNRHEPVSVAETVASLAIERIASGVSGLDLAGDEADSPAEPFKPALRRAKKAGLGITIHAGEWAGAQNVRTAIEELQADRIGHGIRVFDDKEVTALAARSGTVFEVSLTSNWKTGAVSDLAVHPVREMIQAGLAVTLTTDDPSIFTTTLSEEFEIAKSHFDFSMDSVKAFNLIALQSAFLEDREKKHIEKELVLRYWGTEGGIAPDR
ncbi:MAG: adenosine deaminase [Anaerolineales bacterium]|nr:adenosine deaminase [Anaerolineales bacterium]